MMDSKEDHTACIIRFIFGAILGLVFSIGLFVPLGYIIDAINPLWIVLLINALMTLPWGGLAIRWGGRFIYGLLISSRFSSIGRTSRFANNKSLRCSMFIA